MDYLAAKFSGDLVIVTNDGTKFQILAKHLRIEKKVHQLFNGIETGFLNELLKTSIPLGLKKNKLTIGYVGRLSWWKRQDLAIQAFSRFKALHPEISAELLFIGGGEDEQKLRALATTENISEHIKFLGHVGGDTYINALASCDVFLFLYDASNLGNSLWEVMLSGRPVIARSTGDTQLVLEGKGPLIVNVDKNLDEIVSALSRVLEDPGHLRKMAADGRDFVKGFLTSWEVRVEKELRLIEQAILDRAKERADA
ncbi:glycosyltransferase family 4 protein [Variovorax terrae]|uniref:Glycosyltransferase family 4 protein n=1 Tax=Variovorax terrae TaxID=2923278 RepID=A0A9X2ARM2_9BURK|nr:glycosyltransferase family 4 protein [Variovorax terrae]MCJ0764331.1 glycosyltransferase family 4 protein [Variovorax terrae]